MKRDCPKLTEEKEKKKKDGEDAENKHTKVTGVQLQTMFTSSGEELLGTDFSELGENDEFTCHQFHVKGWGA